MPTITDVYEVQPGDTLSRIANHFDLSLNDLLSANQQILDPNLIKVGQKINIPVVGPSPALEPAPGHAETYDGIHPAPGTVSLNRLITTIRRSQIHPANAIPLSIHN